jgi:hypothetical protein
MRPCGLAEETVQEKTPRRSSWRRSPHTGNTITASPGVGVEARIVEDFNGKFAWVVDPEGHKIELWSQRRLLTWCA